jgi:two-component sensor histidine kinase
VGDEEELVNVDGSPGVAYVVKFPVQGPSGRTLIGSVAIDITERKRAEELIKASLREKEVLLREIHHRVKNNLQIVSTLLDLQSGHTQDAAAIEMFQESRGRVKSMALIHERLYRAQDMSRVDFGEYIRQLTDDLFRTYKVSGDIRLDLELDIPPLTIDIAIPCGLLLNELISNCLKHAFANAARGCLSVAFFRKDGANVLIVADDGAGFPAGADFRNTKSFGLQLVNTLVDQLDGEIFLVTNPGTMFTILFPKTNK